MHRTETSSVLGIGSGGASFDLDALANVRFTYVITETGAVPEPGARALMITGFGLAGAALLRAARGSRRLSDARAGRAGRRGCQRHRR